MRSSLALSLVTYLMQMRSFGRGGLCANISRGFHGTGNLCVSALGVKGVRRSWDGYPLQ